MSWAVSCCVEYLREKLPLVTEQDLKEGAKAYTRKRDSGASTGTEAHAMVEDYLKGREQSDEVRSVEAMNAYTAFKSWFEDAEPDVINVEEVIYSEKYQYAGTYDCMLEVDGKVYLCDLKTTNASRKAPNGVYAENFIQLGAYALAHEEQRQYEEANGGSSLVKIEGLMVISAKKNGKLDIATEADMGLTVDQCVETAEKVMGIYSFMLNTTKKLGGK
jgi:hypothetical protein